MENQLELKSFLQNMKSILIKVLCLKELNIDISLETDLVNGVGVDCLSLSSIDYVEFMAFVEEEYNITYDFYAKIHTLGDVYNYIQKYKAREVKQ